MRVGEQAIAAQPQKRRKNSDVIDNAASVSASESMCWDRKVRTSSRTSSTSLRYYICFNISYNRRAGNKGFKRRGDYSLR